jgi:hypothetical protein
MNDVFDPPPILLQDSIAVAYASDDSAAPLVALGTIGTRQW